MKNGRMLKVGDRLWCIGPPYTSVIDGDARPMEPRLAEVVRTSDGFEFAACAVRSDDQLDHQFLFNGDLGSHGFLSEQEAQAAYVRQMDVWLSEQMGQLQTASQKLDAFCQRLMARSMYLHCARCVSEMPKDTSPKDWARLEVAIRDGQIVVSCLRHALHVATFPIDPQWVSSHQQQCACCTKERKS